MSRTQVMTLCALGVALAAGGCAEPEPVAAAPVAQQSGPGPAEVPALHEVQAGTVRRTLRVESHIATEPEVTLTLGSHWIKLSIAPTTGTIFESSSSGL